MSEPHNIRLWIVPVIVVLLSIWYFGATINLQTIPFFLIYLIIVFFIFLNPKKSETKNESRWYIKTTKRNYLINIVLSAWIALLFVFLLYNKYPYLYHYETITLKYFLQLIFLLLFGFYWTYSTIEPFLTRKCTWKYYPYIFEGKSALMVGILRAVLTLGILAWAAGLQ